MNLINRKKNYQPTVLQQLSPRGVFLIQEKYTKRVLRTFSTQNDLSRMLSILDFYTQSFPHRPKMCCVGSNFFIEKYIDGEVIENMDGPNIHQLVQNLSILKAMTQGSDNIKHYVQKEFFGFISQFGEKFQSEKEKLHQLFGILYTIFPENLDVQLHTVHGDIKHGNIIQKQNTLYFIDWERTKCANNTKDIQKVLYKFLGYLPIKTDKFINILVKYNVIENFESFQYLELFYYFLSSALDMMKGRISLEEFEQRILLKCNKHSQGKLF